MLRWRRNGRAPEAPLAELLANQQKIVAYPDEFLEAVADRMMEGNVAHLPILSRADDTLVGYVGWKDLLSVRAKLRNEEKQRVILIRTR